VKRIHPKDAIMLREPKHQVFLAQGIGLPIVSETNDIESG
jgi:hypothetical protein